MDARADTRPSARSRKPARPYRNGGPSTSEPHQRDPLTANRFTTASRSKPSGAAAQYEYTDYSARSKDDASAGATVGSQSPKNVQNIFDELGWAHSTSIIGTIVASGWYELPFFVGAGGFRSAFGGWRVKRSPGAWGRLSPSTSARPGEFGDGPAQARSRETQSASSRSNARPVVNTAAFACPRRHLGSDRGQSDWARIRNIALASEKRGSCRRLAAGIRWEIFNV